MKILFTKIIEIILFFIYAILNIIFIKKKNRITFISFPDLSDNSWHLYKYAVENLNTYEIVWLVQKNDSSFSEKAEKVNSSNKNKIRIVKRWSVKGFLLFCNSKIVFHTHGTYFFIKSTFNAPILVNLWHGMPIKAIGFLDKKQKKDFCYSDFTLATSKKYQEIMSQVFGMPEENVLLTGLPRNDVLYSGINNTEKNKILDKLKITSQEKILLWLPTYRVSSFGDIRTDSLNASFLDDLEPNFLEELNYLCVKNNIIVVVKLHPMDSITTKIKQNNFSNIIFYDAIAWQELNIDLYDVVSLSEGVITDFSSIMIDCLPTKVKVGFIKSSETNYNRKLIISMDELLPNLFIITKPSEFIDIVEIDKKSINLNVSILNSGESETCKKILSIFKNKLE